MQKVMPIDLNLEIKDSKPPKCKICNDFGYIRNDQDVIISKCKCKVREEAISMLKKFDLEFDAKRYTFDKYIVKTEWQKEYKQKALDFLQSPKGAFVMLGQNGLGKSHLMTALTVQLISQGRDTEYLDWQDKMIESKNDYWNFSKSLLGRLKTVEVLYIDDFLKNDSGFVHAEEKRIAMNIIGGRYKRDNLITIISSEKSLQEIEEINGGMNGRIVEMAGGLDSPNIINSNFKKDGNYRLK